MGTVGVGTIVLPGVGCWRDGFEGLESTGLVHWRELFRPLSLRNMPNRDLDSIRLQHAP